MTAMMTGISFQVLAMNESLRIKISLVRAFGQVIKDETYHIQNIRYTKYLWRGGFYRVVLEGRNHLTPHIPPVRHRNRIGII